jgi:hypothetical protein
MKVGKVMLLTIAMMAMSHAKTLQVGGRSLTVPEPEGFVEVTPDMPELYGITRKMVDPDNETLAFHIPAEMADAAKAGKVPQPERYFVLKVQGNTEFVAMDASGFEGLVSGVRSSNQMITKEMKSELGDSFDPAAVVALRGVAFLPPHRESEVAFAHSMLINTVAFGGNEQKQLMSATTSYANVAGKVLILYAYGAEKDLDWTRTAAGAWTDAVLAANPKPPVRMAQDEAGNSGLGQAGGSDLRSGVIGAVIGGVLVFLLVLLMKRRQA